METLQFSKTEKSGQRDITVGEIKEKEIDRFEESKWNGCSSRWSCRNLCNTDERSLCSVKVLGEVTIMITKCLEGFKMILAKKVL